MYTISQKNTIW